MTTLKILNWYGKFKKILLLDFQRLLFYFGIQAHQSTETENLSEINLSFQVFDYEIKWKLLKSLQKLSRNFK